MILDDGQKPKKKKGKYKLVKKKKRVSISCLREITRNFGMKEGYIYSTKTYYICMKLSKCNL